MRRPKVRGARVLAALALPVALLATVGCVAASSYSVFTARTSSPGNDFTVGSLRLANDSAGRMSATGTALFSGADVSAGSKPIARCVTVQTSGSVPASVRLYVADQLARGRDELATEQAAAVAERVTVSLEVGSATSTAGGACDGFTADRSLLESMPLADFRAKFDSFDDGLDLRWYSKETKRMTFRFTIRTPDDMPSELQGASTSVDFVWEAVEA